MTLEIARANSPLRAALHGTNGSSSPSEPNQDSIFKIICRIVAEILRKLSNFFSFKKSPSHRDQLSEAILSARSEPTSHRSQVDLNHLHMENQSLREELRFNKINESDLVASLNSTQQQLHRLQLCHDSLHQSNIELNRCFQDKIQESTEKDKTIKDLQISLRKSNLVIHARKIADKYGGDETPPDSPVRSQRSNSIRQNILEWNRSNHSGSPVANHELAGKDFNSVANGDSSD